ncbi:MAG: hypothetical protein ACPIOQ_77075 [Promethearchaeia archaeon]
MSWHGNQERDGADNVTLMFSSSTSTVPSYPDGDGSTVLVGVMQDAAALVIGQMIADHLIELVGAPDCRAAL